MADQTLNDFTSAEAARAEDAAKDLERIEQETVAEAEASVEDYDAMGNEQAAAEAAETAFEFEEAERR